MTSMISECNMIKEVDETNQIGKRMSPAYFRPDNIVHLKMEDHCGIRTMLVRAGTSMLGPATICPPRRS